MKMLLLSLLVILSVEKCRKKETVALVTSIHGSGIPSADIDSEEPITKLPTYRGVSGPPTRQWRTVPTDMDTCRLALYEKLKHFYPLSRPNYWDHRVFSIDEPSDDVPMQRQWFTEYKEYFNKKMLCEFIPQGL